MFIMSNKLIRNKFIEQTKCAPSKQYEDGSCFTLEALIKIATNYNTKNSKNKINLELGKSELVEELKDLKEITNLCHKNKVKAYLTLNTIVYNNEINLIKKTT